jgi:hypothetical protein
MEFMAGDRRDDVHESGSSLAVGQESVELGVGEHKLRDGIYTISGPPGTKAVMHKPTYSYTIDGSEKKVTDACTEHLELLRKMVTELEADQAIPAPTA